MGKVSLGAVAIILGVGVALAGARVGAQDFGDSNKPRHRGCNEATIEGTYGIQITGTRPSAPGGPMESVIGVVVRHYDGRGQFTQIDNVKGSISGLVPDREGAGTYQVTGTARASPRPNPGPASCSRNASSSSRTAARSASSPACRRR